MIILGIDPGPQYSAFCLWDKDINKICETSRMWEGVAAHKWPNHFVAERIKFLFGKGAYYPDGIYDCYCAIEFPQSFGMPVGREVFETCMWAGRFAQAFEDSAGEPAELIVRGEVKHHICGHTGAKDGNVRQALIDRFGTPGTKKSPGFTYQMAADVWQAFAVGVTFGDQHDKK